MNDSIAEIKQQFKVMSFIQMAFITFLVCTDVIMIINYIFSDANIFSITLKIFNEIADTILLVSLVIFYNVFIRNKDTIDNNQSKENTETRIIVCAANRLKDDKGDYILLLGARHWDDVMCNTADRLGVDGGSEEQGFIDSHGEFHNRVEAMKIVKANGQPFNKERNGDQDDELYSEGLY